MDNFKDITSDSPSAIETMTFRSEIQETTPIIGARRHINAAAPL